MDTHNKQEKPLGLKDSYSVGTLVHNAYPIVNANNSASLTGSENTSDNNHEDSQDTYPTESEYAIHKINKYATAAGSEQKDGTDRMEYVSEVIADSYTNACTVASTITTNNPVDIQANVPSDQQHAAKKHTRWLTPTVRDVRTTRRITGKQYTVISTWLFVFIVAFNGCIYGLLFALAYTSTELFTPTSEKTTAIVCCYVGLALVSIQSGLTIVYCLFHTAHPLVKSRGTDYLVCSLLGAYATPVLFSVLSMYEIGVWQLGTLGVTLLQTLGLACMMLFMGSQIARVRLMYLLFVKHAYTMKRMSHILTYIVAAVWVLLICSAIFTLGYIDRTKYVDIIDILIAVGINVLLIVIIYYTYLTRKVIQVFSDTSANLLTSAVVAVCINIGYTLRSVVFKVDGEISFTNPPNLGASFVTLYIVYFVSSVITVHLYGTIAIIVYRKIGTDGELDPRSVFANTWGRISGGSDYGPSIAQQPTTAQLTAGV